MTGCVGILNFAVLRDGEVFSKQTIYSVRMLLDLDFRPSVLRFICSTTFGILLFLHGRKNELYAAKFITFFQRQVSCHTVVFFAWEVFALYTGHESNMSGKAEAKFHSEGSEHSFLYPAN